PCGAGGTSRRGGVGTRGCRSSCPPPRDREARRAPDCPEPPGSDFFHVSSAPSPSHYVIPISRYIVAAVVRRSRAFLSSPARRSSLRGRGGRGRLAGAPPARLPRRERDGRACER